MSNDAWYQRAMARARETVAPQQRPTPSIPSTWSGGNSVNTTWVQAQPVAQAQSVAQAQPVAQRPPASGEKLAQVSTTQLLQTQAATGQATPGIGAQLNPNACPNCGNSLFYERLTKVSRGPQPAPHCFTCGYNGLFEQGLESSWAS